MPIDIKKLKKADEYGAKSIYFRCARQPQTDRLFVGGSDFRIHSYIFGEKKPEPQPLGDADNTGGHTSYVTGLVFAGKTLISASYDGKLIWWDIDANKPTRTVDAHSLWIRNLVVTPDGKRVISVADDMLAKVWDAETGKLVHTLKGHEPLTPNHYPSMLFSAAVSPDGKTIATADKTGWVFLWSMETGKKTGELHAPVMYTWDPRARRHSIGGIRSLAFSPDGKQLATGGIGKIGNIDHLGSGHRIEIFDWQAGKRLHEIQDAKYKGLVEQMTYSPDGQWLLAAGGDNAGFISFYDPKTGKVIHQDKAAMHVHDYAFNQAGDILYTVGHTKIALMSFDG